MRIFKIAFLQLVRSKLISTIVIVSMSIAIAIAGTIYRLDLMVESRFINIQPVGNVLIGAKSGPVEILLSAAHLEGKNPDFITENLYRTLSLGVPIQFEDGTSIPGAKPTWSAPILFAGSINNSKVIGTEESLFHPPWRLQPWIKEGRIFGPDQNEIICSENVAAKNKNRIGDTLQVQSADGPVEKFNLVGILESTGGAWDSACYISLKAAQRLNQELSKKHSWKSNVIHYILMDIKPEWIPGLRTLVNERTIAILIEVEEAKKQLKELTALGESAGWIVAILIILLGSTSILGVLTTRFEGMSFDIAVFRAIGWTANEICLWIFYQGLIYVATSCIIGAALDSAALYFAKDLFGQLVPETGLYSVSVLDSWPIWTGSFLAVIFSLTFPMLKARRIDITSLLRSL